MVMVRHKRSRTGFTLIELMIVLGIVSMLMVVVFLTFTKAQIRRRDALRRVDISLIADNLEKYKVSVYGGGQYPQTIDAFDTEFDPAKNSHGYALLNHNDPLSHTPYIYSDCVTVGCWVNLLPPAQPVAGVSSSIVYVYGYPCGVISGPIFSGIYSLHISFEDKSGLNGNEGYCIDNH